MEIHIQDIIISIINIIVLFVLLRVILWKYVVRYLAQRTERIQKELDNADKVRQDAESLMTEYQQKIADYEERGEEIIEESRQKAVEEYDRILDDAKAAAERLHSDAKVRIEMEKQQALKDTQVEIAQLATAMASGILKREITNEDNAHIIEDFFQK